MNARLIREHPLAAFFVLAYALAWLARLPLVLGRDGLALLDVSVPIEAILPGTFAPALAALLVRRIAEGGWSLGRIATGWRAAMIGFAAAAALLILAFPALPAIVGVRGRAFDLNWFALGGYGTALWIALTSARPLGEEPGWRGFAQPRLQERFGTVRALLILGVLWTFWHLPLFSVRIWAHTLPRLPDAGDGRDVADRLRLQLVTRQRPRRHRAAWCDECLERGVRTPHRGRNARCAAARRVARRARLRRRCDIRRRRHSRADRRARERGANDSALARQQDRL